MKAAGAAVVAVILLFVASIALAQGPAELQGSVTLRGGQVLTGKIQLAELGVVEGAGIGNSLPGHGAFVLKVGPDKTQRIAADDIASVEVQWANTGTDAEPRWEIKKIIVVKKDGSKVEGAPDWLLHATNVWVITAEGETKRVHVFPFGSEPFNADNLIAKISIGQAPAGPAPAAEKPAAPAKPAEKMPSAPAKPAQEKPPAAPKPAAEKPSAPAAKPPAAKPAAPAAPAAPSAPSEASVTVVAPAGAAAAGPVVAKNAMILLVRCPNCGQMLKIIISADVVKVEHVPQGK